MNRSNIDILQQPARDEEFFLPKIFPKLSRSKEQIILSLVKRDTNKMRRRGLYLAWRGPQNIDAKSLFLFVWMKRWGYKLQQMHPITASQGGEGLIMMILVTVLWKGEDDEYLEWSSSVNKQDLFYHVVNHTTLKRVLHFLNHITYELINKLRGDQKLLVEKSRFRDWDLYFQYSTKTHVKALCSLSVWQLSSLDCAVDRGP